MITHFQNAFRLTLALAVLCGVLYPLLMLGVANWAPNRGGGAVLTHQGKAYFANIGQQFTQDRYFYARPSAVNYNASGAGGSNKGPNNPDYLALVEQRIDSFLAHNPAVKRAEIPADLVTASGSGLDPHLSPAAALVQVPRIAAQRNLAPAIIRQLVLEHIEQPWLGLFGPERVPVLPLNLALDELKN